MLICRRDIQRALIPHTIMFPFSYKFQTCYSKMVTGGGFTKLISRCKFFDWPLSFLPMLLRSSICSQPSLLDEHGKETSLWTFPIHFLSGTVPSIQKQWFSKYVLWHTDGPMKTCQWSTKSRSNGDSFFQYLKNIVSTNSEILESIYWAKCHFMLKVALFKYLISIYKMLWCQNFFYLSLFVK